MEDRYKISYKDKPTPPRYKDLTELVVPIAKEVAFRWSFNGVPHLLVELTNKIVYSLCYFKGTKFWRIFYPYGKGNQIKQDFNSVADMIEFLKRESNGS